jgi:hypothetical protein
VFWRGGETRADRVDYAAIWLEGHLTTLLQRVAELLGENTRHVPHLTLAGIALAAKAQAGR